VLRVNSDLLDQQSLEPSKNQVHGEYITRPLDS
jgi:hypothetical protein